MTYGVAGGLLAITNLYSDEPPLPHWAGVASVQADPFLDVGHCLLALLAAGLGATLAPLVCRRGGGRPPAPAGPTSGLPRSPMSVE